MTENTARLQIDNISLNFGGLVALTKVSLDVKEDEIVAIIGPNGAGKTSLLNCISGFYRPQHGKILFDGRDITGLRSHRIAKLGVARTFQQIELYTGLSTLDNLMAARHVHIKSSALEGTIYFFGRAHREEVEHRRVVEEIIDFLEMQSIRKTVVGKLSYGLRKRVELGRALALEPKLLLLDEPMAGMTLSEKEDMARFIIDVSELRRIPIILIEHDMRVVMDLASRLVVLDFGRKIVEGKPEDVKNHPLVIKAYLGEQAAAALQAPARRR
ncbi:MAG: ABC transporter ATP-binding protein [Chloroflexota bacterium]|nr:MAG: ABC transporter ATP-binding protein [Chloroflexota bacterium]